MGIFLKRLFCDHKGSTKLFIRHIFGDEKKSMWSCSHCGDVIIEEIKTKHGDEDVFENFYCGW